MKKQVNMKFIEKWAERLEEIQWCGEQPSVTFLMAYIYELKEMMKELGIDVLDIK